MSNDMTSLKGHDSIFSTVPAKQWLTEVNSLFRHRLLLRSHPVDRSPMLKSESFTMRQTRVDGDRYKSMVNRHYFRAW